MKRRLLQALTAVGCFMAGMFFCQTEATTVYGTEIMKEVTIEEETFTESITSGLSVEEIRYEGVSGDISWCITIDGTLYLEGAGDFAYDGYNKIHKYAAPMWADDLYSYSIKKAVVNVKDITCFERMFFFCENLETVNLNGLDFSKVTDMEEMFSGCCSLQAVDLSRFDTSKVTSTCAMFYGCENLTELDVTGFDTSNVTNMCDMFYGCSNITELNVSGFDTSNVTDMYGMFYGCSSLTSLDVSKFDTSKVWDMTKMFQGCSSLKTLKLGNFNTAKAKTMGYMFADCSALTSLDVSGFDTSAAVDMGGMFQNCSSLTALDVSHFNTSKAVYLNNLFHGCSNLKSIDVTNFDTGKAFYLQEMFCECSALKKIDVSTFKLSGVRKIYAIFDTCSALEEIDLYTWDISSDITVSYLFYNCKNLKKVVLPKSMQQVHQKIFIGCASLESVFFPNTVDTFKGDWIEDDIVIECYSGSPAETWAKEKNHLYEIVNHTHTYAVTSDKQATCKQKGYVNYQCTYSGCSASYSKTLQKTAHIAVVDEAVEATCTNSGLTEGSHCSLCDTTIMSQEVVPAKGHAEVIDKAVEPTCAETGLTEGSHCSDCGATIEEQKKVRAKGHAEVIDKAVEPTCTKTGLTEGSHCSVCNAVIKEQEKVKAKGHTYQEIITKAKINKDGSIKTCCSQCGKEKGNTTTINAIKTVKLSATTYTYNGKTRKPSVTVKDTKGKKLKKNTDYTLCYSSGCKNPGKYTVTIKFKGNYSGTKKLTYTIKPKSVTVAKVIAKAKGFKVTWKKGTKITGYQVQYSTSKKFTSKTTDTVTVKSAKTTSKTISKLKAKKKYYVRVRTYKSVTVNGKSTKIYSSWSEAKKVTTKK